MERKVAATLSTVAGDPATLAIAVALDLVIGDPAYRAHPVRLIGRTLSAVENVLRRSGMDGYVGGVLLFVILVLPWTVGLTALVMTAAAVSAPIGWVLHVFLLYSLLALGDLMRHVWSVERALMRADVAAARHAISRLVGRDTEPMDAAACRRAAIESLSENLTDGFTSPLFWYVLAGLPGLVLFKVVSTMDSMVGYKTPQYLRFGWFGARLDDAMNYVPARLTWLLIVVVASVLPRYSGRKAFVTGFAQHAVLPGPNAGWGEAAAAGAIERRLVGPIWLSGRLVTETWLGQVDDPPAQSHDDVVRAMTLIATTGGAAAAISCAILAIVR
jgi:adenosylcobinamide-phosphate synthase